MHFPTSLEPGTLIRRYKRFLADVVLAEGSETTVHVPNPGSMLGLTAPGLPVLMSRSPDPKRKLPLTLEMVELPDAGLVGVNTMNPNRIVEAALKADTIPELAGYATLRREVRYDDNSRIDILLTDESQRPPCWVEIKNVHFSRTPGLAEFPDSRTERGVKHLQALERVAATGDRAVMLFLVQRMDCDRFASAPDLDPAYALALDHAAAHGVEVLCYDTQITAEAIGLRRRLPWSR
jgi:sugar fermentation stimulation protein